MAKKKKSSAWTLKPGVSVEDWLEDRRARDRAKLPAEEQVRLLKKNCGYDDDN